MAIETKKGHESTDQPAPVGPAAPKALLTAPIVLRRDKAKGKKRKRYTKGTKGVQRLSFGVSKAGFRTANAFSRGFRTFVKRSNKSALKRRDGMMRDALENASRGFGAGMSTLGRAPFEIASRISGRNTWRALRPFMPFGG